jgi:hypothetical protein
MATRRGELHLRRGDTVHGPLTREQLAGLVASGRAGGADLVSASASGGPWVTVAAFLAATGDGRAAAPPTPGEDGSEQGEGGARRGPAGAAGGAGGGPGWFVLLGTRPAGPLAWEELRRLARAGAAGPGTLVWHEAATGGTWRPLGAVPGLGADGE